MADNSIMSADALEKIHFSLLKVTHMLPTGQFFAYLGSVSSFLYSGESKIPPKGITPFYSGCKNMAGIGGNVENVGSGKIKWNFINI